MFNDKQNAGSSNSSYSLKTAQKFTLLLAILIYLPLNAQLGFGDNKWNVNFYNNLSGMNDIPTDYKGSYTQKLDTNNNFGFNTTLSFGTGVKPTSALVSGAIAPSQGVITSYVGSDITVTGFSYVHKRRGFRNGKYKIVLKQWDDQTSIYIDGFRVNFDGENGWGNNRLIRNCFELNATSTIEVRTANGGAGITQAILEITKTDILFIENSLAQDVCKDSVATLNGKITVGTTNFSQDLYDMNFENITSPLGWDILSSGSSSYSSGTKFIYTSSANGRAQSFALGSFSTIGLSNVKLSYRQHYNSPTGSSKMVEASTDNINWVSLGNVSMNAGSALVFAPANFSFPNINFANQATVYLRFTISNTSSTNAHWVIDDILVTGEGPAPITYLWSPSTGLSNPNIPNPIMTVGISQNYTYTYTVTAGNCSVSNTVPVNMIQIPAQPTVLSSPAWFEYAVVNVPNVNYTWVGVGNFPNGNTTNAVTFVPTGAGNLVVTPTNQCGAGLPYIFNNPLPVTLTNFSADCNDGMTINWSTASEQNSDYYIVEKSRDMQNWTAVNKQSAAGNSNTNINYSAVDANAWNGLAYYRLRQFDFNGDEKIYDPISISCEGGVNAMTVYPNPSKGEFTVEVTSNENAATQLQVIDLTGKIITSQALGLTAGVNQVYFNSYDLTSGVYIVRLVGGNSAIQPVRVVIE